MTTYYLTSDIHIGDGSRRDDFTDIHAARLLKELEIISKDKDSRIVLNGDIFDVWRYGDGIFKIRRDLIDTIRALTPYYVIGNHEGANFQSSSRCAQFQGCEFCHRLVLPTDAGSFYVSHGHEFDLFNGWFPGIGRVATNAAAKIGRVSPKVEDWLATLGGKLTGNGRHADHDEFTKQAKGWISGYYGVHGMFLGHTHQWLNKTVINTIGVEHRYYNLGTWAENGWVRITDRVETNVFGA